MQFLHPAAFWFAFIIPVIVLLYVMKPRYQDKVISSTFLWEQVIRDIEASHPWQKLKRNLLLLLQLLAAFFLLLAMSRPFLPVSGQGDSHIIAVIDCSQSMMAEDVFPNRFEAARQALNKAIEEMGNKDKMTLIAMGEEPQILVAACSNKTELHKALNSTVVSGGSANLSAVLEIIAALADKDEHITAVFFSDGNTQVATNADITYPVSLVQIGRKSDNVGLITLAVRKIGEKLITLARVQNFGNTEIVSDVELYADGNLFDVQPIRLTPGEIKAFTWDNLPRSIEQIEIKITGKDFYPLDNQAYTVVPDGGTKKVLMVSKGNIFLEKALQLVPGLELYKISPQDYDQQINDFDLYVFDKFSPPELPEGSIIFTDPSQDNPLIPVIGEITNINNIDKHMNDSLLSYVNEEGWQILKAKLLNLPKWCRPLLTCEEGALLVVGEHQGQRIAVFAFDLHNSNIPLKTGFPILVNNIVNWLLPGNEGHISLNESKNVFTLDIYSSTKKIIVEKEGQITEYMPPFPSAFPCREPGLYKITHIRANDTITMYLANNQINPLESNIKPVKLPCLNGKMANNDHKDRIYNREIWKYLAWIALLLLVVEWEVYRRGY